MVVNLGKVDLFLSKYSRGVISYKSKLIIGCTLSMKVYLKNYTFSKKYSISVKCDMICTYKL